MDPVPAQQDDERRDAFVGRIFQAFIGLEDLFSMYIGDQLGFYRVLEDGAGRTSTELAATTGTHERYAREWLEHQSVTGILDVDDVHAAAQSRRYSLPAAHAEVLLNRDSLYYLGAFTRFAAGMTKPIADVIEAYRTGGGIPWPAYGKDVREGQGDQSRPLFLNLLGTTWLPAIPDVHARLTSDTPARIADLACGMGWSSIAIARAYPNAEVHGYDIDEPALELARANAAEAGVGDRVQFFAQDIASATGQYQLVTVFEALHDLPRPVEALRAMRALLADDGALIVMDENVREEFTAPGDDLERVFYGFSVLC